MAAPVFTDLDDTPAYTENSSAVVLDSNATIVDPDTGAFDGATLTLARIGGAIPTTSSRHRRIAERQPGRRDGDRDRQLFVVDGALVITFNDQATAARINTVLQALTYANASEAPPASVTIGYTFDNGEQATGSITVGITSAERSPRSTD